MNLSSSALQQDVPAAIAAELDDQYWQFPVDDIMRMLSRKELKPGLLEHEPYHSLSSFAYLVDHPAAQEILGSMPTPEPFELVASERENYGRLVKFLNSCVDNCDRAYPMLRGELSQLSSISSFLELKPLKDRLWPTLKFFAYNRETKDGIDAGAPLKPALVAGKSMPGEPDCYWSLPPTAGPRAMEIRIPVEVKDSWCDIVAQAGMYARAQMCAIPLRLFSLVIGVNHATHTLRFLIYHRGGLTVSPEIDLCDEEGRRDVQRILFSILLWQTPEDAGIPAFTNGFEYLIPCGRNTTPMRFLADEVLFHSTCVRGRGTHVVRCVPQQQSHPSPLPVRQLRRSHSQSSGLISSL